MKAPVYVHIMGSGGCWRYTEIYIIRVCTHDSQANVFQEGSWVVQIGAHGLPALIFPMRLYHGEGDQD
ncbi:hypothetical protein XELAEV_18045516mg [Xenopus laevis]|uniref:Uncharacterized protein n=1 Tax=Xenopus laevis TaxID=8355 RepID=A0A974C0P9_XENLA|nr:hypothetical protein XELAEV_18045516mg [Xenopus laevis]